MGVVLLLMAAGSALLSLVIVLQIKFVSPDISSLLLYYLKVLPLLFAANTSLGLAFSRAHSLVRNLPMLAALQSIFYYICLLICSVIILGDKVSPIRVLIGFTLLGAGVLVLKG